MSESLNSFLFTTAEMTNVFSPQAQMRAMAHFEWALTCALERHGLAESGAGAALNALQDASFVDTDALVREAKEDGNIAIPFVRQLTAAVKMIDERASRAVHLGATSQDVLDTALVLQMRDGLKLLDGAMERLDAALVRQIRAHRNTVLAGRTWLQPGPPTTLGLKLAGTLAALRRHRDRMHAAEKRALVLQLGGAVGTLAVLGDAGRAVSAEAAHLLGLCEPEIPWHTQRDNLVEVVQVLANLTGSLAKLAEDVALLMQAEVGEASEGNGDGRGGSSTLPHKRNPVACAAVRAAHVRMEAGVGTMLSAMPQEQERGLGLWQAEWETVPEAFRLAASALLYAIEIAEELTINAARMQENLDALLGVNLSEAVASALAPKIGRDAAHAILRKATTDALKERQHLRIVLRRLTEVAAHLSGEEIDRLLEPHAYLGSAQRFIAQVLGEHDAQH